MREVIKEGRDVNEAIDLACAQLGVDRGQASFEIIELPKTSLFGLRKRPAKVRVYVEEPEAPKRRPEKTAPRKEIRETPKQEKTEAKPTVQKPARDVKPAEAKQEQKKPEPRQEKPAKPQEKAAAPASEPVQQEKAPEPERKPAAEAVSENRSEDMPAPKFIPMEETEGKVRTACDYVQSVLAEMGVNARITVAQNDNGIVIRLAGEGLGVVIGRRGETLDALQYLSGLVANRCEGDYLRVTIDTGNYREKRERTLQQLAKKLSASALRNGRSSMLEPMNPYERRIIHSTVSSIEGVTSSSIGEEPNRRVVISPVNAKPRPPRRGPGNGPGQGARRNFSGGKRPPRYGEGNGAEGHERAPRRERTERPERRPAEGSRPTSTEVDREYARELEREPAFAKPEQPAQQQTAERAVREKPRDEAGDLPLYGKIDL